MIQSRYYYQLRKAIKSLRRITRGRHSSAVEILNQMRVREYCRYHRCGLAEFGLEFDPAARGLLMKGK